MTPHRLALRVCSMMRPENYCRWQYAMPLLMLRSLQATLTVLLLPPQLTVSSQPPMPCDNDSNGIITDCDAMPTGAKACPVAHRYLRHNCLFCKHNASHTNSILKCSFQCMLVVGHNQLNTLLTSQRGIPNSTSDTSNASPNCVP